MKKLLVFCFVFTLALASLGCGSAPARTASEPVPTEAPEQLPAETLAPVQEPQVAEEAAAPEAQNSTLVGVH